MTSGFGRPIDVGRSCNRVKPSSRTTTETDEDSGPYSKSWKREKPFLAHVPVATLISATDAGDARSLYECRDKRVEVEVERYCVQQRIVE
jgi:hypothetical protein